MLGVAKDIAYEPLLDHFPAVHDRHLIRRLRDDRELVCDEDHGQAEL